MELDRDVMNIKLMLNCEDKWSRNGEFVVWTTVLTNHPTDLYPPLNKIVDLPLAEKRHVDT